MKNKNILIYSLKSYRLFNDESRISFGGAEVESFLIAKELAKRKNFKVKVLLNKDLKNKNEIIENVKLEHISNVFNQNFIIKIFNLIKFNIKLIYEIYKTDVIFQEMATFETGLITFYSKLFKKKIIYRIASDKDLNGVFKKEHKYSGMLFEYGIRNANFLLAQSNYQLQIAKKINKNSILMPSSLEINKKKNSKFNKDQFLWIGRIVKVKQIEIILKIAKENQNKKFIIIGPYSIKNNYVKKILKEINNIKNIKYFKYIKREELNKYYEKSTYLINTSKFEGFPYTMLEAFLNSLPIISLNYNSDQIITNYNLGYFAEGKVSNINHFIQNLNLEERKIFSDNCYSFVNNKHNIKNNIKKIINIL